MALWGQGSATPGSLSQESFDTVSILGFYGLEKAGGGGEVLV